MSAPDLTTDFYHAWVDAMRRLGADPLDVARVAYAETGMYQRARDPRTNAGAVFPFMPDTLRRLGWTGTMEQFRELSPVSQVPWVEKYLRPYAPYLKNEGLVYVATFTPGLLAEAARTGDPYVIAGAEGPRSNIYAANRILDRNQDGVIDVADLRRHLDIQDRGARWETIAGSIRTLAPRVGATAKTLGGLLIASAVGLTAYHLLKKRR